MICDFCQGAQGPLDPQDTAFHVLELNMGGHILCASRVLDTLEALREPQTPAAALSPSDISYPFEDIT